MWIRNYLHRICAWQKRLKKVTLSSWILGDDVALYSFVVVQCTVSKSKYIKSL